eukprot:evm.model.scf_399.9 EVM.evm.TU.scf_399.9   scf_399:79501-82137(+)
MASPRHGQPGRARQMRLAAMRLVGALRTPVVCEAGIALPGEDKEQARDPLQALRVPQTAMGKGLGSGGSATLQRSKLDLRKEVKTVEPKVDNAGGGGGIGKSVFNGGGGDGDDGDDDDDYFDDGEDGDDGDGDGFFRKTVPHLYDRVSISAVLEEWYRSFADLPLILRRAVEMGLFSSAQLVRFCSMDVRPNMARTMSRRLPAAMSRSFVGRLMADPAFAQKLALENFLAFGASLAYEMRARREHFRDELDFVAINTLSLMAATSAIVWFLAPSRSYGSLKRFPWQNMLDGLPNNVFDASGPLRNYTGQSRVASLFAKFAQLSGVGAITGFATSGLSRLALAFRRNKKPAFTPSVPIPGLEQNMLGMCAFVGLHAHLRYQTIGGIDRYLFDHSSFLWSYIAASLLFRVANVSIGEASRPWFQGTRLTSSSPTVSSRLNAPSLQMEEMQQPIVAEPSAASSGAKSKKRKAKGFEMSLVSTGR